MCVVFHSFGDRTIYCPQRRLARFRDLRERFRERPDHELMGILAERAILETLEHHAHVRLRPVGSGAR